MHMPGTGTDIATLDWSITKRSVMMLAEETIAINFMFSYLVQPEYHLKERRL